MSLHGVYNYLQFMWLQYIDPSYHPDRNPPCSFPCIVGSIVLHYPTCLASLVSLAFNYYLRGLSGSCLLELSPQVDSRSSLKEVSNHDYSCFQYFTQSAYVSPYVKIPNNNLRLKPIEDDVQNSYQALYFLLSISKFIYYVFLSALYSNREHRTYSPDSLSAFL